MKKKGHVAAGQVSRRRFLRITSQSVIAGGVVISSSILTCRKAEASCEWENYCAYNVCTGDNSCQGYNSCITNYCTTQDQCSGEDTCYDENYCSRNDGCSGNYGHDDCYDENFCGNNDSCGEGSGDVCSVNYCHNNDSCEDENICTSYNDCGYDTPSPPNCDAYHNVCDTMDC